MKKTRKYPAAVITQLELAAILAQLVKHQVVAAQVESITMLERECQATSRRCNAEQID